MTRKLWLVSLFVYIFIFLALTTWRGELLILAIPLLVYLAFSIYFAPETIRLKVERTLDTDKVLEGRPVKVKLSITNQGPSLEEVFIEDKVSTPFSIIEGEMGKWVTLPAGGMASLEYTLLGQRGQHRFKGVRVTAREHFGLFQSQEFFPAPAALLILPSPARIRRVMIHPPQTRGFVGPIPSRQAGSGVNFFGVREYQLGDPLRRINWKVSTRHEQDIFTNESEQERIADVGLILDARRQSNVVTPQGSLFEYSIRAAASLAEVLLKDGHRVGLLVYGYGMDRVFPGYGKVQLERILRALAQAKTGQNYALESMKYLPTRLFPAHSQIIMVSPLVEEDLSALIRLRAYGYAVIVICPDPIEFENGAMKDTPVEEYARRLARIERELLLRNLKRAGIQVINWEVNLSLDQAIQTSLAKQPAGPHILELSR